MSQNNETGGTRRDVLHCASCGWIGLTQQASDPLDASDFLYGVCPACHGMAFATSDEVFHIFQFAQWTDEDQETALSQGWSIFDVDSSGVLEIEAYTEAGVFETDTQAAAYVSGSAAAGDPTAVKALLCIAKSIVEGHLLHRGVESDDPTTLERAIELDGSRPEMTALRAAYGT